MAIVNLETPLNKMARKALRAGDHVRISGIIYTARDAAHKRMMEALERGEALPLDFTDELIYYVGPCPAKPGDIIGSAGPTTSGRMDAYTPELLDRGLAGMIGKGNRSERVINSMMSNDAVYFACVGGAGALLQNCIKSVEVLAYEDLGTEAIRKIEVKDFPAIVVIDTMGNNLYETERKKFTHKLWI
ncbi:Fe-S-containing hydro-lyase [Acetobacterium woodii]|uniref:Fumarate hydratase beta subunit FumB n=1 Tax=Acetobacterium woodii (strain ATCC 29683 / DSM 1030 / JCM 2381 / KCTC 1655 / WB1) TaxID=931626 RepID=H6LF50_ACEWD|nr:Fe-S-containing hydro-lyase [Acetobacterium woodii]AFA48150.1 fumarate hydratase beta subunit FumB [Acetobacterium woodii DSM 1030]